MRRLVGDIDIDFPDRNRALIGLDHIPSSIFRNGKLEKHNTGVYFHAVPVDPLTGLSSMEYISAENAGWFKIDLLNVGIYEQVKDERHLIDLMERDLDWRLLEYPEFTSQLIHLGNHADMVARLKPASIGDIAMILALIRPGKRHLEQKCQRTGFSSISNEIWTDTGDVAYSFKKAHAHGYAMLVKVHANLLVEQASA
jgi:hypothetical protein